MMKMNLIPKETTVVGAAGSVLGSWKQSPNVK